jgi:hypothetical protein
MTDERTLTAIHELGHAIVAHAACGVRVLTVSVTPGHGVTTTEPPTDPDALGTIAAEIVRTLAGDIAELVVEPGGFAVVVDDGDGAALAASLDRLDDLSRVTVERGWTAARGTPRDREQVELLSEKLPAHERAGFLAFCDARAWRYVVALAPTIAALVPWALANPVFTGSDLESALAALPGQKGT